MSKASALLSRKCPRCRKGKVFQGGPFSKKFNKIHTDCPHCGFHFEIEPGFFWGSMYINYGLNMIVVAATGIPLYFALGIDSTYKILGGIIIGLALCSTLVFQYGRVLMLYLFSGVTYQGDNVE